MFAEEPGKQPAPGRGLGHVAHDAAARGKLGARLLVTRQGPPIGGKMHSLAIREQAH